jgi:hypothetical protein
LGHWVEVVGAQMGHETPDRAHGESPG